MGGAPLHFNTPLVCTVGRARTQSHGNTDFPTGDKKYASLTEAQDLPDKLDVMV